MDRQTYLETLALLGCSSTEEASKLLGVSQRHCQRLAAGKWPISRTIELLLGSYVALSQARPHAAPLAEPPPPAAPRIPST
jgi:hypothetical protein